MPNYSNILEPKWNKSWSSLHVMEFLQNAQKKHKKGQKISLNLSSNRIKHGKKNKETWDFEAVSSIHSHHWIAARRPLWLAGLVPSGAIALSPSGSAAAVGDDVRHLHVVTPSPVEQMQHSKYEQKKCLYIYIHMSCRYMYIYTITRLNTKSKIMSSNKDFSWHQAFTKGCFRTLQDVW